MLRILQYYGRFASVKGSVSGLPAWARALLTVAALPGLILLGLSILAGLISILALLLLTVPLYRILKLLTSEGPSPVQAVDDAVMERPRRQVDVTIVE